MPYIKQDRRRALDPLISGLLYELQSDGEINYVFTKILIAFYEENYAALQNAVGLLECVKQEFVRRRLNPLEDRKIKENGDVY